MHVKQMKAVVYTKYGPPDVLQLKEIEKPVPKKDEVLVKIHASSVNSWDWDLLKGKPFLVRMLSGWLKPRHQVLGADIAGTIEQAGDQVTKFHCGDEVFGDIAGCGFGGFAEYVTVPEKMLAKKPSSMSFEQAAALPQAGLLALQGLYYKTGILQPGLQLLINGAGGGVGTLALQYAKHTGAEITCVDKSEKFDLLRSLGAHHLIDYTKADYTRTGQQYDMVLDVIAHRNVSDYKRVLKPGGRFVMIGGSMGGLLLQLMLFGRVHSWLSKKKLGIMGYQPNREDLEYLVRLFEEGKLKPIIDKIFPLHKAQEAFSYFGTGNVQGKVVMAVIPGPK